MYAYAATLGQGRRANGYLNRAQASGRSDRIGELCCSWFNLVNNLRMVKQECGAEQFEFQLEFWRLHALNFNKFLPAICIADHEVANIITNLLTVHSQRKTDLPVPALF